MRYTIERDFFSLGLMTLTLFLTILIIEATIGDSKILFKTAQVIRVVIILVLLVVFILIDLISFYFTFEFVVIPIFLIIMVVGGSLERLQSSLFLFLYTLVSSIPFLIFVLQVYRNIESLNLFRIYGGFFLGSFW